MKPSSTLKRLIISATRQKLIGIFFTDPGGLYYVRQLVRLTGEEINSVRRELNNLRSAGLISSEKRGNRLYYWVNADSPLFHDLIVLAHKTTGLAKHITEAKNQLGKVKLMAYSHQFALNQDGSPNDIDMVLIGKIGLKTLQNLVKKEEDRRNREINYMVMDKSEFQLRKSKRDPFIVDFFLNCPLIILGNPKNI